MEATMRFLETLVSFFLSPKGWLTMIAMGSTLGFIVDPATVLALAILFLGLLVVIEKRFDIGGGIIASCLFIIIFFFVPMGMTCAFVAIEYAGPIMLFGS